MSRIIIAYLVLFLASCSASDENENPQEEGALNDQTELQVEELIEVVIIENPKYVLFDGLELRAGASESDEVIRTLKIGDTVDYLDEFGELLVEAEWVGYVEVSSIVQIMLADGTKGWVQDCMLGDQEKVDNQYAIIERRNSHPNLAKYEGTFVNLIQNGDETAHVRFETCECGFDNINVSFKEDEPMITLFEDCGSTYINVSKVEVKKEGGLRIEGYSYPDYPYIVHLNFSTLEGENVLNYSIGDSSSITTFSVPEINQLVFDKIDENCEGLYEGY